MSKQTMGEFLALLRKANGFTQQDVADKLNISNRTLSSWETDRTTPDILLLPSIADLYGVTVDELLRCERNTAANEDKPISSDALRSANKHRFGKYSAKFYLLSGLGCFGAVLLALSFVFALYTACPTWLFILLVVLSACDIIVCAAILFYFHYNAKLASGIILNEDYTDENKAYALALKKKTAKFFLFCGIPLIAFAVIMIIVALIAHPENYEIMEGITLAIKDMYVITICVTGSLGITFLLAYFIYANANVLKLSNEKQTVTHKQNAKLFGKTFGFGVIPLALISVLILIFAFVEPVIYHSWLSADTSEDFKKQIQTLKIDEDDYFHTNCGKPVGEYYLNFPENYEQYTIYSLGNGFCALYDYNRWDVYLLKDENRLPVSDEFGFLDNYNLIYDNRITCDTYSDFGINYVNVACNGTVHNETVFGLRIDSVLKGWQDNGKYEFGTENTCNLAFTFIYLFIIVAGITIVTCTVVYFTRRKKQKFEFK